MIETATDACSVALFCDGALVDARHEVLGRGHAERLIALIADLRDGGRADHILVSCGPGSFTGIRVGVAAARGLALGWGSTVAGYSTLAALAAQAFEAGVDGDELSVVMHGGHGEVFAQSFTHAPFAAVGTVESVAVADGAKSIMSNTIVGSAAAELVAARGWGVVVEAQLAATSARALPAAFLGLSPSPIYGRGADAKPMP